MDGEFRQCTAISGSHVGPFKPNVLEPLVRVADIFSRCFYGLALSLFLVGLLGLLTGDPLLGALGVVSFGLAVAGLGAGIVLQGIFRYWVPVAPPEGTLVRFRARWLRPGYVHFVARWEFEQGSNLQLFRMGQQRAIWRTPPLKSADGESVIYDVALTFEIDTEDMDGIVGREDLPEEVLYRSHVLPTIRRCVRATVSLTERSTLRCPRLEQTPFLQSIEQAVVEEVRPEAARYGLILHEVFVHNPQRDSSAKIGHMNAVQILPPGDKNMNDNELVRHLQRNYNIGIPDLFDPDLIKYEMEQLKGTGLLKQFTQSLSRRFTQKQQLDLLRAWQEYYEQVGDAFGARQAAQQRLQRKEEEHRLFLQECFVKTSKHSADIQEHEARAAEAKLRQMRALQEIKDINNPKPFVQPISPPTLDEERARIERNHAKKAESIKSGSHDEETERRLLRDEQERYESELKKAYEKLRP